MKKTIRYNMIHTACIGMAALLLLAVGIEANETAQLTDETIVYYVPGKNRCHLADCKRRNDTMSTTTWAEAKTMGLKLCSRCPGSTTPAAPKKDKNKESELSQSGEASQAEGPFVYYTPGKKRCHLKGCKRISADMSTMPLAEAKAQGIPFCSKCPTNITTSATDEP